jgi:hypothetical protein
MTLDIDKLRTQVNGSIWQALAQSGVELSSISQGDKEKLVARIADSVLVTMDDIMGNQLPPNTKEEVEGLDERVIWKGRPFLSLNESYTITSERVKISSGLVARHVENFELIRIQDIDFNQGVGDRVIGIGDITIRGHDASNADVVLRNISKPEEVYEILRRAWLEARKRHGLTFSEFM